MHRISIFIACCVTFSIVTGEKCVDLFKDSRCNRALENGHCVSPVTQRICPKSCGVCNSVGTCVDTFDRCDRVVKNGACVEPTAKRICPKSCGVCKSGLTSAAPPTTRPRATEKQTTRDCTTMNGKRCVFPFVYKGTSYSSCIKDGYHTYWCSTANKKDGSYKEWDICGDERACGKGDRCVDKFFNCKGVVELNKCTSPQAKTWCAKSCEFCGNEEKKITQFHSCNVGSSQVIQNCSENEITIECKFKGRSRNVHCAFNKERTHFECKGIRISEELKCCDYTCNGQ